MVVSAPNTITSRSSLSILVAAPSEIVSVSPSKSSIPPTNPSISTSEGDGLFAISIIFSAVIVIAEAAVAFAASMSSFDICEISKSAVITPSPAETRALEIRSCALAANSANAVSS